MKNFLDRPHKWNEILIQNSKKKLTRGQIKKYYEKNIDKIFPYLKDRDILVIFGIGKNKFVLKRLHNGRNIHINKKYGIDDPHSFEYWINRRVIEFHPVIGAHTKNIWVDIDIYDGLSLNTLGKKWALIVENFFRKYFKAKTKIWISGRKGYHIEGYLSKPIDVNQAREDIKMFLASMIKNLNDNRATLGIAKHGQLRLDITTLKRTGSIRAPYSFSVAGTIKRPTKF